MSSFFGIEVEERSPAYFRPDDNLRSVRLRRATLVVHDDTVTEQTRVVVKCRIDRGAHLFSFASVPFVSPSPAMYPVFVLTSLTSHHTGPSYVLASLVPNRSESVPLDVVFTEDVRISVRVMTAAADDDGKYAVHLTGNVNDAQFEFGDEDEEGSSSSEESEEEEEEDVLRRATRATEDELTEEDTGMSSSSESWGSDYDDVDGDGVVKDGTTQMQDTDEVDAERRAAAARTGVSTNIWVDPVSNAGSSKAKQSVLRKWDPAVSDSKIQWAYHLQTAGARFHRRSVVPPKFKWTGGLRPFLVSPRRLIPKTGWLVPLPDYATSGWPEDEFGSKWQKKLEVKSKTQIEKMRAACRLGRFVMDVVARHIAPGVTTDELDRICHVTTIANGAYPSPRNYMGFPKSLCTSVNETVCHGIPDARQLQDGDIVNLDVTVCLNGYHGDLNETYLVRDRNGDDTMDTGKQTEHEASVKLMRCAYGCLSDAIEMCGPGVRFRDLGEAIQTRADREKFAVVKDFCGHGIGEDFHCAPNVPHYSRNKAVGTMKPGMTFTIEPMVNAGTRKCITWPDGWTAVTADGARSAQYEHTLLVTEQGVEVLTARTGKSTPLW